MINTEPLSPRVKVQNSKRTLGIRRGAPKHGMRTKTKIKGRGQGGHYSGGIVLGEKRQEVKKALGEKKRTEQLDGTVSHGRKTPIAVP